MEKDKDDLQAEKEDGKYRAVLKCSFPLDNEE